MRERSSLSTTAAGIDLTIRLGRGSVIVQAAHRRHGHLYVDTADCRVAVTGTLFGVSAGVKGSRVSVVEGEVHVDPGQPGEDAPPRRAGRDRRRLEPESVRDEIAWSRNRDRYYKLLAVCAPAWTRCTCRRCAISSRCWAACRRPRFLCSIPNLAQYLGQVQIGGSTEDGRRPELARWWSAQGRRAAVLEKLRAASEYLGDEIVVVVAVAEASRGPGFAGRSEARRVRGVSAEAGIAADGRIAQRPAGVRAGPRGGGEPAPAIDSLGRLCSHALLCAHRRILPRRRRPAAVRRPGAPATPNARPARATSSPSRKKSTTRWRRAPPGLRRRPHRDGRLAGRTLAHGLAGLCFAGRHAVLRHSW